MTLHKLCADFAVKPKIRLPDLLGALWKREDADCFRIGGNKI
jgi:hypothetical protein